MKTMSAKVFCKHLKKIGMSQADMARYLKRTPRQVNRWARGKTPIPHTVVLAIKGVEHDKRRCSQRTEKDAR